MQHRILDPATAADRKPPVAEAGARAGFFLCCGLPYAGLATLRQALNQHPEIACTADHNLAGLRTALHQLVAQYQQSLAADPVPSPARAGDQALRAAMLAMAKSAGTGKPICGLADTTLLQDLATVSQLMDHPPCLILVRNPVHQGQATWHAHQRRAEQGEPQARKTLARFGDDLGAWLKASADRFADAVERGRRFASTHPNAVWLRCEDLEEDPAPTLRRVAKALGAAGSADLIERMAAGIQSAGEAGAPPPLPRGLATEILTYAAAALQAAGYGDDAADPTRGAHPSPAAPRAAPKAALPADVAAGFRDAVAAHTRGALTQARTAYQRVLSQHPGHFDALHMMGVLLIQSGEVAGGVAMIEKALTADDSQASAHSNLGNGLLALKRYDDALAAYDRALACDPNYAGAHNNRGSALHELGRIDDAVASFDRAISLTPDYAQAHANRGNALRSAGRSEDALAAYDRALSLDPNYAQAHCHRALALRNLNRYDEALEACTKALEINPRYAEAHRALGILQRDVKRYEDSIQSADRALAIDAQDAKAYNNRGNAQRDLKRYDAALASYDQALAIDPNYAEAQCNRGNVLRDLHRHTEAVAAYDRAIALKPSYAEAYSNRGSALCDLRRHEEAIASCAEAIALRPDLADPRFTQSIAYLQTGNFKAGWPLYEWRWKRPESLTRPALDQPLWLGKEAIDGRTVLAVWEQGLGDTLQFCRYADLLHDSGARVILQVQRPLVSLLAQMDDVATVIGPDERPADCDFQVPLLSLPLAFGTDHGTIPIVRRPLACLPEHRDRWARRLGSKTKPRIGLAWSGSANHKDDHNRSMPLTALLPLLSDRFEFISLHKEVRDSDRPVLETDGRIAFYGDAQEDFSDAAALVDLVDVVVTVDTAMAHLAGTMGKPVWILLSYNPDWRWMLDRDDSPWYPSARLFRQAQFGRWDDVVTRVRDGLEAAL